jgi:nicotinamidase-related amidase
VISPQLPAPVELWNSMVSDGERERITNAGFGRRCGLGARPALMIIDAQRYMVGPVEPDDAAVYPASCGDAGREALANSRVLAQTFRSRGWVVIYTRFEVAADGSETSVNSKVSMPEGAGWLRGTPGAEIVPALAPRTGDVVVVKNKPSAFQGTPLLPILLDRGVDTLVVTGGSTSNCVRATVVDAASLNYRVIVPAECVFDRVDISHRIALFDIDRMYGDVVRLEDLVEALETGGSK